MGQQQLFIVIIAALIAWEVIWGSMKYIDSIDQGNERDVLVTQIHSLITDAIQYKMRPTTMGGGNGNLIGFQPPRAKVQTERFRIYTGSSADEVIFSGFGSVTGTDEETPVHIIVTFSATDRKVKIETLN